MTDTAKIDEGSGQTTAESDIVISAYVLFLRRQPENKDVISQILSNGLKNIAKVLINAVEFSNRIANSIEFIEAPSQNALDLDRWRSALIRNSQFLNLSKQVTQALKRAVTWDQVDHAILTDDSLWQGGARNGITREKRRWLAGLASIHDGLQGNLYDVSAETIAGWCRDQTRPSNRLSVNIYADNAFIGTVRCDEFRRDLLDLPSSDGKYGFFFKFPLSAQAHFNVARRLTIRESLSGRVLGAGTVAAQTSDTKLSGIQKIAEEVRDIKRIVSGLEAKLPHIYKDIGYTINDYYQYYQQYIAPLQSLNTARKRSGRANGFEMHLHVIVDVVAPPLIYDTLRSLAQLNASALKVTLIQIGAVVDDIVGRIKDTFSRGDHGDALNLDLKSVPDESSAVTAILEQASGFAAVMFAGDVLSPNAFDLLTDAAQDQAVSLFYFDDDIVTDEGRHIEPRLKPAFDFDFCLAENYVGSFFVWNAALARTALEALPIESDLEGVGVEEWLYAMLLRLAVRGGDGSCKHIPWITHHRRSIKRPKMSKLSMLRLALPVLKSIGATAKLIGTSGGIQPSGEIEFATQGVIRIEWSSYKASSVTIIIPTRDEVNVLRDCISSVRLASAGYAGDVEILIVDNMSTDIETLQFIEALESEGIARTIHYQGAFNWAAANNLAAERSHGDMLICLNNDTKILSDGWIEELVSQASRPDVGAVGAKLVYADGTVQHGGAIIGLHGAAGHDGVGLHSTSPGYLNHLAVQRNVSAVTGACLATRKDVWRELGGFDEINFPVAFNDTDYCLRVRESGLKVIYTPFALAFHYESKSRGLDPDGRKDREAVRRFKEKWRGELDDPFYNRHFDRFAEPYALLTPRFAPGTEPEG